MLETRAGTSVRQNLINFFSSKVLLYFTITIVHIKIKNFKYISCDRKTLVLKVSLHQAIYRY